MTRETKKTRKKNIKQKQQQNWGTKKRMKHRKKTLKKQIYTKKKQPKKT